MNWAFWRRKSRVQRRREQLMEVVDDRRVQAAAATITPALFALAAQWRKTPEKEKTP